MILCALYGSIEQHLVLAPTVNLFIQADFRPYLLITTRLMVLCLSVTSFTKYTPPA